MGQSIMLKCSCGYEKSLMSGIGFLFGSYRKTVFDEIQEGKHEKYGIKKSDVSDINDVNADSPLDDKPDKNKLLEYRVCKCDKCRTYAHYLHYSITMKDGSVKVPVARCEKCGSVMRDVNINRIKKINCPECKKTLYLKEGSIGIGCWD